MGEMPHRSEHLKSTTRDGSVSGVAVATGMIRSRSPQMLFGPRVALTRRLPPPLQTQPLIDAGLVSIFVDARIATSFGGPLQLLS